MTAARAHTSVIVVGGGGTIGSSTALHLVRTGYTPANITVLDTFEIPSPQSAGHDLNKIMSIRLRNPVDLQMSLEALHMWKNDPLLKPFFHNTGRVMLACTLYNLYNSSPTRTLLMSPQLDCAHTPGAVEGLKTQYQRLLDAGAQLGESHEWLDGEDDILAKMPLLHREQIRGWKAIWSRDGGWLAAAKAINAIGLFLKDSGVRFGFGG